MYRSRFKKFGGGYIPDVVQYIKSHIENDPAVTISVGCDSIQRRRKTVYAITIMIYNTDLKKGAHVVFFRDSVIKVRDNNERLYKEAQWLYDVGNWLNGELEPFYKRSDLSEFERKRYKYHLERCAGKWEHIELHNEIGFIKSMTLLPSDLMDVKLVDLHADFNPFEGSINERGVTKNKSNAAYKSYVPWLRGMGYRVWAKPMGPASTSAADLLLQD